ncbi:MAG: hypothetical protein ACK56I_31540, partial [bacterium]
VPARRAALRRGQSLRRWTPPASAGGGRHAGELRCRRDRRIGAGPGLARGVAGRGRARPGGLELPTGSRTRRKCPAGGWPED